MKNIFTFLLDIGLNSRIIADVEKTDFNTHTNRIFAAYGRFMELL